MGALTQEPVDIDDSIEDECDWDGSVNYYPSSDSEFKENNSDDGYGSEESEFSELEGKDLKESLQKALEAEIALLTQPTPYEDIQRTVTSQEWKNAEKNRGLGYNRHADRTQHRHEKKARDKEKEDKELCKM